MSESKDIGPYLWSAATGAAIVLIAYFLEPTNVGQATVGIFMVAMLYEVLW